MRRAKVIHVHNRAGYEPGPQWLHFGIVRPGATRRRTHWVRFTQTWQSPASTLQVRTVWQRQWRRFEPLPCRAVAVHPRVQLVDEGGHDDRL